MNLRKSVTGDYILAGSEFGDSSTPSESGGKDVTDEESDTEGSSPVSDISATKIIANGTHIVS